METVSPNRVYQADARDFLGRLRVNSVDLIFIDPPYGNDNGNDLAGSRAKARVRGGRKSGAIQPIANDDSQAWKKLMPAVIESAAAALKPTGVLALMCAGGGPSTPWVDLTRWIQKSLHFDRLVVWDKSGQGPGMGNHYRGTHELILVGHKRGSLRWAEGRVGRPDIVKFAPIQTAKQAKGRAKFHENEKPVELAAEFILNHTEPGDVVVDCFCGSGSTLIAAQQLGRVWYGCDLEPVDVAQSRLRNVTPDMFVLPEFGNQVSIWDRVVG